MADNAVLKPADGLERKKKKSRILYILLGVCIVAVIISAAGLGYEVYLNSESQQYYSSLAADIPARQRYVAKINAQLQPLATTLEATQPVDGVAYTQEQWMPYVNFDALRESLSGISAWIKLDNTKLNYPLMQGADNYFYLSHLPDGTKHRSGSIFIDYRNNADFSDKSTLVYGHASKTGDMFGILKNYRKQSFYEENPVIYIYTPDRDYALVLVAGYLIDSGKETPPQEFKDDAGFQAHISSIKQRSLFVSDVDVSIDDRIVSLCTCAYDYPNARLVIVGKLVELQ